jgi:hypothetical protein
MFKKLAVLAAALAVSAPAFADRGHGYRHGYGHGYGHKHRTVVHKHHYVVHRPAPVVHHYYHRPAPQPVVVVHRRDSVVPALLVGTIIGAAIVHHAATAHYGY